MQSPAPDSKTPWLPERWRVDLWGAYAREKPPGPEFRIADGRFVHVHRFGVRQLWPYDKQIGVLGDLCPDGSIERYWIVKPSGHELTTADKIRAVRGLELITALSRRSGVMESGELLGRLEDGLNLARRNDSHWWAIRPVQGALWLARGSLYRYFGRFGWSWPEIRGALTNIRLEKETKTRSWPVHDELSESTGGPSAEISDRNSGEGVARSHRIGERRSALSEGSRRLVARARHSRTNAAGAP